MSKTDESSKVVTSLEETSNLYVAGENKTILVLNPDTLEVLSTIELEYVPYYIALSIDEKTLYAANTNDRKVSIINLDTLSVIYVDVDTGPFSLAVHPDGSKVYTGNTIGQSISIIDTQNHSVTTPIMINLRGGLVQICIDPEGDYLYFTSGKNGYGNGVFKIDTKNNQVLSQHAVINYNSPYALAINSTNTKIYVTAENYIEVIDVASFKTEPNPINLDDYPSAVAFSPNGETAYAPCGKTLKVINVSDKTFKNVDIKGVGSQALTVSHDGNDIYVSNLTANSMSSIEISKDFHISTVSLPTKPQGSAISLVKNQINISNCDNELVFYAYTNTYSYMVGRIVSGYHNTVKVSIHIEKGTYTEPELINGLSGNINKTIKVQIPVGSYSLVAVGINWGKGESHFHFNINGIMKHMKNKNAPSGTVFHPDPIEFEID